MKLMQFKTVNQTGKKYKISVAFKVLNNYFKVHKNLRRRMKSVTFQGTYVYPLE